MQIVNWSLLALTNILIVVFLYSSIREKEPRAVLLALISLAGNSLVWLFFNRYFHLEWVSVLNLAVLTGAALFVIVSLVKYFPKREKPDISGLERCDERDIMFSRNRLQFHPHLAERYYDAHPEKREVDKKIHGKPELGEPGHLFYDDYSSPAFEAAFEYLHRTQEASVGPVNPGKKTVDKEKMTRTVKDLARFYGAADVGITPLKPYHIYSHHGRNPENWGEEVTNTHTFAVVVVVAMEVEMIKNAPRLPVISESSRQYVESAKIAHIIAQYIRGFGYSARSHTDGNYEVLCVPSAVDAGLGVLGRMGLFMHPVHGPCIRISVVTTEMELIPNPPLKDTVSIETFCDICKKCADNCPTQSIDDGEEPVSRGFRHWSIRQETCFSYWKNIGTDCGFCIRVCPYTKPDTFIHKLVRFYISRNPINQRVALFLDDLFYRRKIPIPTKKNQ